MSAPCVLITVDDVNEFTLCILGASKGGEGEEMVTALIFRAMKHEGAKTSCPYDCEVMGILHPLLLICCRKLLLRCLTFTFILLNVYIILTGWSYFINYYYYSNSWYPQVKLIFIFISGDPGRLRPSHKDEIRRNRCKCSNIYFFCIFLDNLVIYYFVVMSRKFWNRLVSVKFKQMSPYMI